MIFFFNAFSVGFKCTVSLVPSIVIIVPICIADGNIETVSAVYNNVYGFYHFRRYEL